MKTKDTYCFSAQSHEHMAMKEKNDAQINDLRGYNE